VKRPLICRWGFHRWGPNRLWPKSTPDHERWERICTRCGAGLVFSDHPFTYGPIDRYLERRRAPTYPTVTSLAPLEHSIVVVHHLPPDLATDLPNGAVVFALVEASYHRAMNGRLSPIRPAVPR
jgi:hypothetical protein